MSKMAPIRNTHTFILHLLHTRIYSSCHRKLALLWQGIIIGNMVAKCMKYIDERVKSICMCFE